MRFRGFLILVVLAALMAPAVMAVDQFQPKNLAVGLKAGLVTGGTVNYQLKGGHTNKHDFSTDDGLDIGIFLEHGVYRKLKATLSADAHNIRVADVDISEFMIDIAVGAKLALLLPNSRFAVRPGVCLGYGHLSQIYILQDSHFTTLKIYSEFVSYTVRGGGAMLEVGAIWAPSGTDGTFDGSAGPMLLLRGGLVF